MQIKIYVKRKDSELEAKSRALEEKDATISAMSEQITKTREYLASKQQVSIYALILLGQSLHRQEGSSLIVIYQGVVTTMCPVLPPVMAIKKI